MLRSCYPTFICCARQPEEVGGEDVGRVEEVDLATPAAWSVDRGAFVVIGGIKFLRNDGSEVHVGNTTRRDQSQYFTLEAGECITSVQVRCSDVIDALYFNTSHGRRLGHMAPSGSTGGELKAEESRPGYYVSGFEGFCVQDRGVDVMHRLSLTWLAVTSSAVTSSASQPTEHTDLIPPAMQVDVDAPPGYSDALNYDTTITPSAPPPPGQDGMPPPSYDEVAHIKRY